MISSIDLLIVISEPPEVSGWPLFAGTVGSAGASALSSLTTAEVIRSIPEGREDADPPEGPGTVAAVAPIREFLRAQNDDSQVALVPGGLVNPPGDALEELAGNAPAVLRNRGGQGVAVVGSGPRLAPLFGSDFGAICDAAVSAGFSEAEPVSGAWRIVGASTWTAAVVEARRRTAVRFARGGVFLEDPETLWADPTCEAEPGARIGPSVRLSGATRISAGAEIGAFCALHDADVGPNVRIRPHTVVAGSRFGPGSDAGPFAHLRVGTELGERAHVGGFVETKNTRLGDGAAVPHLSYFGDAEVGPRANVGAGSITCNYDGRDKHRTVIGDAAFVGSNSTLVAPVAVGDRAFVAAGSVVTDDVPGEAMAIARGRQVVKPGRAKGRYEGADGS